LRLQAGQIIAGRYEIDKVLGQGGMAVVYRALDTKLDRYIALKILREELAADQEFVKRFPIEAMAAAALSHPNIVSIYDYGQDQAVYYIVLEHVDGSNLKEIINHHAPFSNDATLGMALQIADGLAAAHSAEIVHRDIKPQNILVTNSSNAKIADFGIARVAKSGTITASESMGSAQYFSPEQARGGYVDHRTDIYSLGIVMFEMATGQLPFDGDNVVTVALKQINDPLPDMTEINPNISPDIVRIVKKATDKSPTKRYQHIEDMAEDLVQALTDASDNMARSGARGNAEGDIPHSNGPMPNDYPASNDPHHEDDDYGYPDENEDNYQYDHDDYYDEPRENTSQPDRKSVRTARLIGVGLGLIFALLILLGSCAVYNRFRIVRITPPDVVGMTVDEATEAARNARLGISVMEYIFHNEIPEGRIIYQSPTPEHTDMAPGSDIHITVSLGPSVYTMPDILNMHIDEALELLDELPIHVLQVEDDHDAAAGTVVLQEPEAGTPVGEGTTVIVYVSRGEEEEDDYVLMPNLLGLTADEAQDLLEEVSLSIDVVQHDESTTFAQGMIFSQYPMPGTIIERGSVVGITISTGTVLPPTPSPSPEPDEDYDDPYADPDETDPDAGTDTGNGTDSDDPDNQTDEPLPVSRVLNIQLWYIPEGTPEVGIRVTRQPVGGSLTMVTDSHVNVADFPLPLNIYGNGVVVYRVYAVTDGVAQFIRSYEINFDE